MYNNKECKVCEIRGAWIATVYNIDWPKIRNDVKKQKEEFINILDKLKELNFNAVFVQIRATSDALYKSCINPWSEYLTGTQGKYPGYDPLEFMIKETHKRGMEFHAWLNPYRVTARGTDVNALSKNNPARINPDWVIEYNNALFYDPENPQVIEYIATTVYEIIKKYYVDGIHFDDYFYPYNYPLPQGEDREGTVANNRREAVNNMIRLTNIVIKSVRPCIKFGVSPFGVWKNKSSDINGSDTKNLESYYDVYGDSVAWINEEIIDYIAPQLYWTIGDNSSDYKVTLDWWVNITKNTNVDLYIGQGINKEEVAKEISQQIEINRSYSEVKGSIFFSMTNINENTGDIINQLKDLYNCIAKIPQK